jgi:double-stranded uracil-DNA glycosylase
LQSAAVRLAGLAPVVDGGVHTLVLGSFPSVASLQAGQYYAHPRNQFWLILESLLNERLAALPYSTRLARIQGHGIGLWDVIATCERAGSLDGAIRNGRQNDFTRLRTRVPQLRRILLNGRTAGRAAGYLAQMGFCAVAVPSSSPAHASMSLAAKIERWRVALDGGGSRRDACGPERQSDNGVERSIAVIPGGDAVGHNQDGPISRVR